MLPTARELARLTEATRFEAASLEKVVRLAELLDPLGDHPDLRDALTLKGGTALNLFFGPPRRLSVDLDFNFTAAEDLAEMQARRPLVERAVEVVARSQGYAVQLSRPAHAGRKLFLGYQRLFDGGRDRVQIDVNFLNRVALLPAERRRIWRPDGAGAETALASWVEIAAGKLVALLDRTLPRDAWDSVRLRELSPTPWPPPALRPIFIATAGTLPRPLYEYGPAGLERITEPAVVQSLHPMLLGSERPTAEELRTGAWEVVGPLLGLSEPEREYCARLQAGELRPELLFPADPELAGRVRRHPALLWKTQNARAHVARARQTS